MPATVEQTTTDPTITYDMVNHSVNITVIVSLLDETTGALGFATPPIVIERPQTGTPKRLWTLTWHFQPDSSAMDHILPSLMILVPAKGTTMPVDVIPYQTGPSEWIIPIDSIDPTEPINPGLIAFAYDILAGEGAHRMIHDPTIVVTQEPIG